MTKKRRILMVGLSALLSISTLSANKNNEVLTLNDDAQFCKTKSGFREIDVRANLSYFLRDDGPEELRKKRGCKLIPKYTTFISLEENVKCEEMICAYIKLIDSKEIGLIHMNFLK